MRQVEYRLCRHRKGRRRPPYGVHCGGRHHECRGSVQQVAAPGDILVSAATRRSALIVLSSYRRGPAAQGKARAGDGVQGPRLRPERTLRSPQPLPGQLIGRERELAALEDALPTLRRAVEHLGRRGRPGLGEITVAARISATLAPRARDLLEGRCLPYAAAAPYGLVLELLRSHCDLTGTDPSRMQPQRYTAL